MLQRSIQGASRALPVPTGPSFLLHPPRATSPHLARLPVIPRKRNSDVALTELSDTDSDAPRPKKPRLDPSPKHPLLAVNPNLPPYITTQHTTVPNPPAGSPGPVIPQPAPIHVPSLSHGPVQSINEVLNERDRVAACLSELRSSLSTRPDIDRSLVNINAWQQRLFEIDNQIVEMQMTATPEGLCVPPNLQPPFLVPTSTVSVSTTPEPGPSMATHDVYPGYIESEGETSNVENDQSTGFPSLPMSEPAISTTGSSRPAKYVGSPECLQHSLILPSVCRNSFKIAIEISLTLTLPYKKDSKSSDFVILRIPSLEWSYHSCPTKYWESPLCWIENEAHLKAAYLPMRWESVARNCRGAGTQLTSQQLGKTVQTIATMTQNQGANPAKKTNLIGKTI